MLGTDYQHNEDVHSPTLYNVWLKNNDEVSDANKIWSNLEF